MPDPLNHKPDLLESCTMPAAELDRMAHLSLSARQVRVLVEIAGAGVLSKAELGGLAIETGVLEGLCLVEMRGDDGDYLSATYAGIVWLGLAGLGAMVQ